MDEICVFYVTRKEIAGGLTYFVEYNLGYYCKFSKKGE
jgi:hypothetical protein